MHIETTIKKHSLTLAQAERVRTIWRVGNEVVDLNVNDFLYNRIDSLKVKLRSYAFKIIDQETMKKRVKGWCYGYCDYRNRQIVINLDHALNSSIGEIVETMLHEAAHAVAYHLHGDGGHGRHWKRVSRLFGSSPKATTPMEGNLAAKVGSKYKMVVLNENTQSVEVIGTAERKQKNLGRKWAHGRKRTQGMLWLVKTEDFERIGMSYENLTNVAIR